MENNGRKSGFRDSFRGYNKDDVNSYITSSARTHEKQLDDLNRLNTALNEKIKSLEEENRRLSKRLDDFDIEKGKSDIAALTEKNTQNENLISALNEKLSETDQSIEKYRSEIDRLSGECRRLKETINNMSDDFDSKIKNKSEKADLYDKMKDRLGQLIISANEQANEIISDAKQKSGGIIENAEKSAGMIKADVKNAIADTADRIMKLSESLGVNNVFNAADNASAVKDEENGIVSAESEDDVSCVSEHSDSTEDNKEGLSENIAESEDDVSCISEHSDSTEDNKEGLSKISAEDDKERLSVCSAEDKKEESSVNSKKNENDAMISDGHFEDYDDDEFSIINDLFSRKNKTNSDIQK